MKTRILVTLFLFATLWVQELNASIEQEEILPCRFIYQINTNLKSKRQTTEKPIFKYALLNTCKPFNEKDFPQRQVITVYWEEEVLYREIVLVETVFSNYDEAFSYAKQNQVPMAFFKDNEKKVDYIQK